MQTPMCRFYPHRICRLTAGGGYATIRDENSVVDFSGVAHLFATHSLEFVAFLYLQAERKTDGRTVYAQKGSVAADYLYGAAHGALHAGERPL